MKDFLKGLAHVLAVLALCAATVFAYNAGYSKGAADMLLNIILSNKGKSA